jgi:hypothetical protein
MEKAAHAARQVDTNKIKQGLPVFFAHHEDYSGPYKVTTPLPMDKSGRGLNHVYSARALCPRAHIYAFDNDEKYACSNPFIR